MDGLIGIVLGTILTGIVALAVQKLGNDHAERLAREERRYQDEVRRKSAGASSAKAVLKHLDDIRAVFDAFPLNDWRGTPDQQAYKEAYEAIPLAAVDIDNKQVAKTLTDIGEAYFHAWLATDQGEWRTYSLNRALFRLAHATVRAYTQDEALPDRSELDRIHREIDSNIDMRVEQEEQERVTEQLDPEDDWAFADTTQPGGDAAGEWVAPASSEPNSAAKTSARPKAGRSPKPASRGSGGVSPKPLGSR